MCVVVSILKVWNPIDCPREEKDVDAQAALVVVTAVVVTAAQRPALAAHLHQLTVK